MEKRSSLRANIRKSIQEKREEVNLANLSLTKSTYLQPEQPFPLVIQPTMEGVNLPAWAAINKKYIHDELARHGAILFRNFKVDSPTKFEEFARTASVSDELFDEYGDLP